MARRSIVHVIGPPGRTSTTAAVYPIPNLTTRRPQRISVDIRQTLASLARPLGTHRPPLPRGLISARKTFVPPKRHSRRSLIPWTYTSSSPHRACRTQAHPSRIPRTRSLRHRCPPRASAPMSAPALAPPPHRQSSRPRRLESST
jgi:hypothetical protein